MISFSTSVAEYAIKHWPLSLPLKTFRSSESGRKFWRTCQVLSRNLFDFLHILHNKKVVKASILLALTT